MFYVFGGLISVSLLMLSVKVRFQNRFYKSQEEIAEQKRESWMLMVVALVFFLLTIIIGAFFNF